MLPMNSWFVYMVECVDSSIYTGITTDPLRRVQEHNGDRPGGARYTRSRQPVQLIYQETCESRGAAAAREYAIKQLSRKEKLALRQGAKPQE